jgi:hypothetical protein
MDSCLGNDGRLDLDIGGMLEIGVRLEIGSMLHMEIGGTCSSNANSMCVGTRDKY